MKPNELRIGNSINYHGEEIIVRPYTFTDIEVDAGYEPIPLTEEWLLKFGFEKYEFDHKENQYRYQVRLIVIRDGKFVDYGSSVLLEHIHQLQNFFFALTGEELTFKNK
jgi:hypothetical protein